MPNDEGMKIWNWNNSGKMIIALEVKDMDEARSIARQWNRSEGKTSERKVAIITNTPVQAHATKICAV